RPGLGMVQASADFAGRYRSCAISEDHSAAKSLAGKILSYLYGLGAFRVKDPGEVPTADRTVDPLSGAEHFAAAERKIINTVRIELMPSIKEGWPVLDIGEEARGQLTRGVLDRTHLIERLRQSVVEIEGHAVRVAFVKAEDHRVVIRPAAVGAEKQVERLLVVVGSRREKVYAEIPNVVQITGDEITGEKPRERAGGPRAKLILKPW